MVELSKEVNKRRFTIERGEPRKRETSRMAKCKLQDKNGREKERALEDHRLSGGALVHDQGHVCHAGNWFVLGPHQTGSTKAR